MNTNLTTLLPINSKYDNLINTGATIKGKFEFSGTALIQGIIYGDVEGFGKLMGALNVSSSGKIFGSIRCTAAFVNGTVIGNIYARQISLEANSTVQGDIYYETLGIHASATVNGRLIQQQTNVVETGDVDLLDGPMQKNSYINSIDRDSYSERLGSNSKQVQSIAYSEIKTSDTSKSYSPKRIWGRK